MGLGAVSLLHLRALRLRAFPLPAEAGADTASSLFKNLEVPTVFQRA